MFDGNRQVRPGLGVHLDWHRYETKQVREGIPCNQETIRFRGAVGHLPSCKGGKKDLLKQVLVISVTCPTIQQPRI